MIDYYRSYFHLLIHPVYAIEQEAAQAQGLDGEHEDLFPVRLGLPLKILLSWPFQMLETFYMFLALGFGSLYAENLLGDLAYELGLSFSLTPFIVLALFSVVLFPLQEWVEIKIWEYMIWIGLQLFKGEAPGPKDIGERISLCLSTHTFRAVPLIGPFAAKWGKLVSIGIVLVKGHNLSFIQAAFILSLPLLFIGLMMSIVAFSIISLFAI